MRSLVFEGKTWQVYEELRTKDQKLHKNLCKILKEMSLCGLSVLRGDPSLGLGKPKPLKHNLSGFWSRRLSPKDRLIYKFDDSYIHIFAIGGHYEQYDRKS